jgi:hypothetical protein
MVPPPESISNLFFVVVAPSILEAYAPSEQESIAPTAPESSVASYVDL